MYKAAVRSFTSSTVSTAQQPSRLPGHNGKSTYRSRPRCLPPTTALECFRQSSECSWPYHINTKITLCQPHSSHGCPQRRRYCNQRSRHQSSGRRRFLCRARLPLLCRHSWFRSPRYIDISRKGKNPKSGLHSSVCHSKGEFCGERPGGEIQNLRGNRCMQVPFIRLSSDLRY